MEYIKSLGKDEGCFLCQAAAASTPEKSGN